MGGGKEEEGRGGMEEGVGREGGICVIGFRGDRRHSATLLINIIYYDKTQHIMHTYIK